MGREYIQVLERPGILGLPTVQSSRELVPLGLFLQLARGILLLVDRMIRVRLVRVHGNSHVVAEGNPNVRGKGNRHPPGCPVHIEVDPPGDVEIDLCSRIIVVGMLCAVSVGRCVGRWSAFLLFHRGIAPEMNISGTNAP